MSRPVKAIRPSDDDAQTKFMSRPLIAAPASSGRRAPIFTEERTLIDVPRPSDDGERTIVAPLVFPKVAPRTTLIPKRTSSPPPAPVSSVSKQTPSSVRPAPRPSQPPPLPGTRASAPPSSPLPRLVPPPPPSSTKLFEGPTTTPIPAPVPSENTSSPALVSDVTPSVPPPAPGASRARQPMILLAAALGVLGMIFTMGIVVGLVVSLRSHVDAGEASLDRRAAPVAAGAGATLVPAVAALPAPVAEAAVVAIAPVRVAASKSPPVQGPADTLAVAKVAVVAPVSAVQPAPARVVRPAPVAMAAPVARPAPVVAPAKRARAASSDADLDAANAASDLAKAQLEASLR